MTHEAVQTVSCLVPRKEGVRDPRCHVHTIQRAEPTGSRATLRHPAAEERAASPQMAAATDLKRGVELENYRNFGIMAHIDAGPLASPCVGSRESGTECA